MEKIGVKTLVEEYIKRENTREAYLKSAVKIKDYVDYSTKIYLAKRIIEESCLLDNRIYVDSCKKYLLYIFALFDTYTNIELDPENWINQYDSLNKLGLIDIIFSMLPKPEIEEFRSILDMKLADLMTNKYEMHAFINENIERYSRFIIPVCDAIKEKADKMDEHKMNKFANKLLDILK